MNGRDFTERDKLKENQWLCYSVHWFFWHGLGPRVNLDRRVTANLYKLHLTDHIYRRSRPHPQGLRDYWMVSGIWKCHKSYSMAFTLSRSQPDETPMKQHLGKHLEWCSSFHNNSRDLWIPPPRQSPLKLFLEACGETLPGHFMLVYAFNLYLYVSRIYKRVNCAPTTFNSAILFEWSILISLSRWVSMSFNLSSSLLVGLSGLSVMLDDGRALISPAPFGVLGFSRSLACI